MSTGLSFGPLGFRVHGSVSHPLLEPFERADVGSEAMRVDVVRATLSSTRSLADDDRWQYRETPHGPRIAGEGYEVRLRSDIEQRAELRLDHDSSTCDTSYLSALGALVSWRAVREAYVVLHAGAVRVANGKVAALLGPSGIGKSTAVRENAACAFAYNALLVRANTLESWPLPFTGNDDPVLVSSRSATLVLGVVLEPSDRPWHEWLEPSDATKHLVEQVVVIPGDSHGQQSVFEAVRMAGALPCVRLGRPLGLAVTEHLSSAGILARLEA